MFKCLLKVKKVETGYRSLVTTAVFNGTRNISLTRHFQIFQPSSALAPVPFASHVAQDPMSALRRPFILAPPLGKVIRRAAGIFRGGGGCVWVMTMETSRGVRGYAPPENFRKFELPWTAFGVLSWWTNREIEYSSQNKK